MKDRSVQMDVVCTLYHHQRQGKVTPSWRPQDGSCIIDRADLGRSVQMDVVCTHPMFGPDSGKGSWKDLNLMYERVRVGGSAARQQRVATFLKVRFRV